MYYRSQVTVAIVFVLVLTAGALAYNHDWSAPIPEYVIDLFQPNEFSYPGPSDDQLSFKYRLFIPRRCEPGITYPLLLWTSGYGQRGDDNFGQLMHLHHVFRDRTHPEKYRFFVLAMQNPDGDTIWCKRPGTPLPQEPATVLMEILGKVVKQYPVDVNRIYLSGVSAGGTACWEIALRYPDRFAAIVPLGSNGADRNLQRLKRLINTPVWAFHCTDDPSTSVDQVRNTVDSLKALGAPVHLTEIDAASHDCWTPAFRDYGAMDWMLAQTRDKHGPAPGLRPWKWWNYAFIVAVPTLLLMVLRSERKRRAARFSRVSGDFNETICSK